MARQYGRGDEVHGRDAHADVRDKHRSRDRREPAVGTQSVSAGRDLRNEDSRSHDLVDLGRGHQFDVRLDERRALSLSDEGTGAGDDGFGAGDAHDLEEEPAELDDEPLPVRIEFRQLPYPTSRCLWVGTDRMPR